MSDQSEPERYSIDDMMERLKSRPAEDPIENGELVTRADGSQAIRVRKRKRRSHQPHKEERARNMRSRMLQVSGALILVLLAVFAACAAIVYANSTPFRENLVRRIGEVTGANVEMLRFRMNPTAANADSISLSWPEGNVLGELKVQGIRAQIAPQSFLGKTMVGDELSARSGSLHLKLPQAGKPERFANASTSGMPFRFGRYAIPKLDVLVGDPAAPVIGLWGAEASLQMAGGASRPMLLLNRGQVAIDGWPKLGLERSHIEFRGSQVDVLGMRLRYNNDDRGTFELAGNVSPFDGTKVSTLAVSFESYPLAGIAGPELGHLFSGRIDSLASASSNYLAFSPGNLADASLVTEFRSSVTSPFELNGFPFLLGLSQALDDVWFTRPTFENDVKGVIRRANKTITLSSISLENKTRLAIRGSLNVTKDRRIDGNLDVGVSEPMIKAAKDPALEAVFGQEHEGFRWVSLKISGGVAAPADNFRELHEAAKAARRKDGGPNKTPSFEELTAPR